MIVAIKAWFADLFTFGGTKPEVTPPRIKFPEGTILSCPKCKKHIGVANQDVFVGNSSSSAWDGIDPLSTAVCPDDGASYIRNHPNSGLMQAHTNKGWMG